MSQEKNSHKHSRISLVCVTVSHITVVGLVIVAYKHIQDRIPITRLTANIFKLHRDRRSLQVRSTFDFQSLQGGPKKCTFSLQ